MHYINELVGSMNKEEVRHLKLYLNRTATKSDRKDVQLFDYIRKSGGQYDEDKIVSKLYGKDQKNPFYRLKNRLADDIGKSLFLQYYAHTDTNMVLHHLTLSRHFHRKQLFMLARNYLSKAEKKALKNLQYDLLDLIYADFIKLSHDFPSLNPERFIEKRKANRKQLSRIQEIDDILAALTYRIRTSANYSSEKFPVVDLLQATIAEFTNDPEVKKSPVLRFKIYHALSRILLQERNYEQLEIYLKETLAAFTEEGLFNKNNHDTKLQMLTYLANCLFKNNHLQEALDTANALRNAMDDYNGFLREKYLMYYYNALINNYSQLNIDKALRILEEAANQPAIQKNQLYSVILKGQRAQLYFDQHAFRQANRSLIQMKLDDAFENLDRGFRLKIRIAELIIRYELNDTDFIEYEIPNIEKAWETELEQEAYGRQSAMLRLLKRRIVTHKERSDAELRSLYEALINGVTDQESADRDWINYNEWLKRSMQF